MSNFIPPSKNGQIVDIDLRDLTDHPLLAGIPMWAPEAPEFAALRESIRGHGLDYELLVDNSHRIVDGRQRRNALAALGGAPGCRPMHVPCRIVSQDEAASIVVSCLVNRRHLTKGATAYLVAPLFTDVLAEAKKRICANLRHSTTALDSALSAESMKKGPKTTADIAAQVGIGIRLFEQAIELRKLFAELGDEARAKYEPRLLGPWVDMQGDWHDPVGLGYMINGLKQLLRDKQVSRALGKRAQHDRLFSAFLPKLALHWNKATDEQRAHIIEELRVEVAKFPEGLRDELAGAIRAAKQVDKE